MLESALTLAPMLMLEVICGAEVRFERLIVPRMPDGWPTAL
ncbi:MAG: hypothetical protein BWZ10_01615 [candidate division BRC1 bacterium ADurb.BinA364]|nr:MAG: hypothetical protein BWZ10_01615 [candidate division BRC1 bacterium ADurb.BinA364]